MAQQKEQAMRPEHILGKQTAELKTTFLYKVNVAVAVLLLYLNIQSLVGFLLDGATQVQIIANSALILLSLAYGLLAINGYVNKIQLYERGITIKSLFSIREIADEDIAHVSFRRINQQKLLMYITLKTGKFITLRSAKYEGANLLQLVEYLARFKKDDK